MKRNNFIKRALVALTFALAVAVLTPAAGSVDAQAATKKTANKNYKKAPAIKVNKTYKITSKTKGGNTYVKFTAPKSANYVFTIYDVKNYKPSAGYDGRDLSNFYIRKKSSYSNYLSLQYVKTQGGKATCLFMATPQWYSKYPVKKPTINSYLKKRTATLKLNKGETVYVNMYGFTGTNSQCTYMLKVKKK